MLRAGRTVTITMALCAALTAAPSLGQERVDSTFEPLPILMYDTDIGLGYGVKGFLLSALGKNESFDLILFNSTGGERWYKLVFSLPDFEFRQGTVYPLALDLSLTYNRFLKNKFFGVGNQTRFSDEEHYTRTISDIRLTLSRGITRQLVAQVGIHYRSVVPSNFETDSIIYSLSTYLRQPVTNTSIFTNLRYDTRDSFINPTRGVVLQADMEHIPDLDMNDVPYTRWAAQRQIFRVLRKPDVVFAFRGIAQDLEGHALPVAVLLPIGGVNSMRGMAQDRLLDSASALINAEVRFPIHRRLGGVAGFDAGNVWNMSSKMDLSGWASNLALGLWYYMETFVVRVDIGFGRDAFGDRNTGFYFNFGHLF